jgi:hypothetical protein
MSLLEKIPKLLKAGILIILFLIVAAAAKVLVKAVMHSNNESKQPLINQEFLDKLTLEVNKSLPKIVDSDTRLDYVDSVDNKFTYHYTILTVTSFEETSYLRTALPLEIKPKAVQYFCGKKIMRQVLDAGIPIIYSYNTQLGRPIVTVAVTKEDCR